MPLIYFAAGSALWPAYEAPLRSALPGATIVTEAPDPAAVDYIIFAPGGDIDDFRPFTRAKAVLNLWAGVERIVGNPTLTQPLCRMVDPSLTEGMVEWVTGQVLRFHLGLDRFIGRAPHWDAHVPPLARERPVTILGMGELGQACAAALTALNFPVTGWSRTPREVPGIRCLSGDVGDALDEAQIAVLLLPNTPGTENVLNARTLVRMAPGAAVINPGRGPLIDDAALLAALDSGQIAQATLDVFRQEPLPPEHPFWHHPRVTVTPHVAASTRASGVAQSVARNIRRAEAGEPLLHLVDRARGY